MPYITILFTKIIISPDPGSNPCILKIEMEKNVRLKDLH